MPWKPPIWTEENVEKINHIDQEDYQLSIWIIVEVVNIDKDWAGNIPWGSQYEKSVCQDGP